MLSLQLTRSMCSGLGLSGRTYATQGGSEGVALIAGAGEGCGGAVARRFAKAGYTACVVRRTADKLEPLVKQIEADGGKSIAFGVDCRKESEVVDMVAHIEKEIGPIEVAVHNIGGNVKFDICDTTAKKYFKVWEMACFSGFLIGREAAKHMLPRERGTILFTGATASVRGGSGFAAFSGAKHGLRALAQSMARELGPKGIHVGHIIVDGAIDTPWIEQMFGDKYAELISKDGILQPDAIAETYYMLHTQPRSAWTHEIDVRPWMEKW
eukprot:comp66161_c0_seq1/m.48016 comp66161_c0_seq1/g.48016  ORF comp66161_c0_seq1/g.48016 comp66161_c0_seq1/m.48016 type:complete len:268 (-) comp66161_c0_seq1:127-930(-)